MHECIRKILAIAHVVSSVVEKDNNNIKDRWHSERKGRRVSFSLFIDSKITLLC